MLFFYYLSERTIRIFVVGGVNKTTPLYGLALWAINNNAHIITKIVRHGGEIENQIIKAISQLMNTI